MKIKNKKRPTPTDKRYSYLTVSTKTCYSERLAPEKMYNNPSCNLSLQNDDKQSDTNAMVIGAVILTTVMIAGFLGLALLSYRRCRARLGYDSLGYSKLGEEESNLLRGEFT